MGVTKKMKNMKINKLFCKAAIVLVIASLMLFSLASVPEVASAYTPTSEDLEYMEWQIATSDKLIDDSELISAEIKKGIFGCDWEYLRTLCKLQYNHAETALNEIDKFEVSPELEPIKKEYKLSLIDTKWEAHYLKEVAEDYLSGDYEGASDNLDRSMEYTKSSLAHSEKVFALIEALPTPTPESPGFGAIFAIGSLSAVAYLVLRRR